MYAESDTPVFVVLLRRPGKNDPRTDPFYEFGSFGLTGCHRRNLLHPRMAKRRLEGARMAFVQGGDGGARLICLTPPVTVLSHSKDGQGQDTRIEVCWNKDDPAARFFKYDSAPIITDIGDLAEMIKGVARPTPQAKLSSKFRSSTTPLPPHVADALVSIHSDSIQKAVEFADRYEDTLPFWPRVNEQQKLPREHVYQRLLLEAQGFASGL